MKIEDEIERNRTIITQLGDLARSARNAATLFGSTELGDAMREFLEDVAVAASSLGGQYEMAVSTAEVMMQHNPKAMALASRVLSGDVTEHDDALDEDTTGTVQ